jgi:GTP-binding protein HflX
LIALVGYTNAGKSTLFNKLTGASVLADNIMFATLDPTKRRMFLNAETGNGQPVEVVLCDTVGFIRDLPKELINAFRATLDDVRQATIILHIVDCAEDGVTGRIESVDKILKDMNLESQVPKIMVFNKVDQIDPVYHDYLRSLYSVNTVFVSSYKDIGLDRLKTAIYNSLPK